MSERKLLHKSESQTLTLGHDLSTDNSVIVTLQPVPPPQRTSSPATTTTPTTTPTPTRDTYCLKDVTGWRHRKLNYLWEKKHTRKISCHFRAKTPSFPCTWPFSMATSLLCYTTTVHPLRLHRLPPTTSISVTTNGELYTSTIHSQGTYCNK